MVALLVLWELALAAQQCRDDPRYFEVILATATLCIALWVADLRKGALTNWWRAPRVLTFVLYDLCAFFLLLVLFAIPVLILTPTYQCYTARARISEVILSASSNRVTIAERAERAKTLKGSGLGLTIVPNKRVSGGLVSADGIIIVTSEDPPAFAVLRPRLENGIVQWTCGGLPIKDMPGSCRAPPF